MLVFGLKLIISRCGRSSSVKNSINLSLLWLRWQHVLGFVIPHIALHDPFSYSISLDSFSANRAKNLGEERYLMLVQHPTCKEISHLLKIWHEFGSSRVVTTRKPVRISSNCMLRIKLAIHCPCVIRVNRNLHTNTSHLQRKVLFRQSLKLE